MTCGFLFYVCKTRQKRWKLKTKSKHRKLKTKTKTRQLTRSSHTWYKAHTHYTKLFHCIQSSHTLYKAPTHYTKLPHYTKLLFLLFLLVVVKRPRGNDDMRVLILWLQNKIKTPKTENSSHTLYKAHIHWIAFLTPPLSDFLLFVVCCVCCS